MGAALAGVAVGGAAPFVLPDHPDATLLALCSEGLILEADYGRLCWSTDDFDERHKTQDGAAAKIAFAECVRPARGGAEPDRRYAGDHVRRPAQQGKGRPRLLRSRAPGGGAADRRRAGLATSRRG